MTKTSPLLIVFLAGCMSTPQVQDPPVHVSVPDRLLYGVVQELESSTRYLLKDACAKQDSLCALAKQTARETEMARVAVMGSGNGNLTMQVLVPKSRVKQNDIIQYRLPPAGQEGFPSMTEVGAKAEERKPGVCDWVDGTPSSFTGGVLCNGWSYKSLRVKP